MNRIIGLPFVFLLSGMFLAVTVFSPVAARADSPDSGKVFMVCRGGILFLEAPKTHPAKPGDPADVTEEINVNSLTETEASSDQAGDTYVRTGSKALEKSCGGFHVKISGGYYKEKPHTFGGSDYNFPVVSVSFENTPLVDHFRIGFCSTGDSSQHCADEWAESIGFFPHKDPSGDSVTINLDRHYEDIEEISLQNPSPKSKAAAAKH